MYFMNVVVKFYENYSSGQDEGKAVILPGKALRKPGLAPINPVRQEFFALLILTTTLRNYRPNHQRTGKAA